MAPRSYTSPVRTRHAEDTRRAILEAALTLFNERGYSRTSVAAVAEAAGVALNTVYTSVGGKPALMLELVQEGPHDELIARTVAQVAELADPWEILQLVARRTGEVKQRQNAVVELLVENRTAHPDVTAAAEVARQKYRDKIDLVAVRLIELHAVRPGLGRARVEQVLWYYFGPLSWGNVRELGWGWKTAADWLAQQAASALLVDPPTR